MMPSRLNEVLSRFTVAIYVGLIALCVLAFANSFGNDFVYDDVRLIRENENLHGFGNARMAFTADYYTSTADMEKLGYYRPFAILLNFLDYKFWKRDPTGFHLTNLILHIVTTFLVFRFSRLLAERNGTLIAAIAAMLFAVHPVHTEAVTFISGRVDPLSTLFYLASLIAFVGDRKAGRFGSRPRMLLGSLFFAAALLSKEMAVTLPVVLGMLLVYRFSSDGRGIGAAARSAAPRLVWPVAVFALYLGLRYAVLGSVASRVGLYKAGDAYHIPLKVALSYIRNFHCLVLPPSFLNLEPEIVFSQTFKPIVAAAFFLDIVILALAFFLWKRSRLASVGILWVFLTLLPVSGLIPVENILAERFLYLPSVGAVLGVAVSLAALLTSRTSGVMVRAAGIAALAAVLWTFTNESIKKNTYWSDEKTLWTEKIKVDPGSAKAFYNLATNYHMKGQYAEAEKAYLRVLARDPSHYKALNNLGLLYQYEKRYDRAEVLFKRALAVDPRKVGAHYNLGNFYIEMRDLPKGAYMLKGALKLAPRHLQARANLAMVLMFLGHPAEAIPHFEEVLRLSPGESKARMGLALAKQKAAQGSDIVLPIPEGP